MNDNLDSNATKRKRTTKVIVDSPNNLDLDGYIGNYKGAQGMTLIVVHIRASTPLWENATKA